MLLGVTIKPYRLTAVLCEVLIFAALLASPCWAKKCNSVTLTPGLYHYTIDGHTVVVRVPSRYTDQQPVPVLLDLHGSGLTGDVERLLSRFEPLSEKYGFIAVWPSGPNFSWAWDVNSGPTDMQYIRNVVDYIRRIANVDRSRIYVIGISAGGGMTNTLVCHAADVFAAAGPDSMELIESTDQCRPSRPVSVMEWHGYEDTTIPYNGGATSIINNISLNVPSAPQSFLKWAQIMGCEGGPVVSAPPDGSGMVQKYETCSARTQVGLGSVHAGHGVYAQLRIQEYTWAFLSQFTLPLTQAQLDACPGDPPAPDPATPDPAPGPDPAPADSGGGGGGGGCFIATATFGSHLDPHVAMLREFRDKHLVTNILGRRLVRLYYRYSPGIAVFIARHEGFRAASRAVVTPLVYAIAYPYGALLVLFSVGGVILIASRRRS